jgi:flagellar basal body-associated protein FliL
MKCTNCGCELSEGAMFCKQCGTKIVPFPEKVTSTSAIENNDSGQIEKKNEKKKSSIPVIVCLLVLLVIGLGAGVFFIVSDKNSHDMVQGTLPQDTEVVPDSNEANKTQNKGSKQEQESTTTDKSVGSSSFYANFYNTNYADKKATPYFVDMDEDDDLELIVISVKDTPTKNDSLIYEDTLLEIYDKQGNTMEKVFSDPDHERYSIILNEEGKVGLIYSTLPNYIYDLEGEEQFYYVSLSKGEAEEISIPENKYRDLLSGAISINESIKAFRSTRLDEQSLSSHNYSVNMVAKLVAKAKADGELINDALFVNDNSGVALYATLGPVQADVERQGYEGSYYVDSYAKVLCVDSEMVITDLGQITLADKGDEYGDEDLSIYGYGEYKFGDISQYYVDVCGVGFETQYKYGDVNGKKQLIDSELEFFQNEEGIYCCSYRQWGEWNSSTEYVEITFTDGEYKQYSSSLVSESEMDSVASNWQDIVDSCTQEIYAMDSIALNEYEGTGVAIDKVTLSNVREGTNGKYYVTFDFSATDSYDQSIKYNNSVYFTFRCEGDVLVRESIVNYIDKLETSELDLAIVK